MATSSANYIFFAVEEINDLLQRAHFAARDLEEVFPLRPSERLSDRIHSVRTVSEALRYQLQRLYPDRFVKR